MRLVLWFLVEREHWPDDSDTARQAAELWLAEKRRDPEAVGGSILPYFTSRVKGAKGWRATVVYCDRGHNRSPGRHLEVLSAEEMKKHDMEWGRPYYTKDAKTENTKGSTS